MEQQTRADALPLPPPPTILTNKAEELTKPETTVADKPKPQAQPIPDEADLPKGELTVRPKAQPQTQPKASEPTGTVENVPSPYKNQPNTPQFDPTKLVPPIVGAGTTSTGKLIADKVNGNSLLEKYSNTEKYIGEKLSRPDPNNPSAIHPRLPDNGTFGAKTSGILVVNGKEIDIISGYDGASAKITEKVPGMNARIKAHVEGHVAAIMRLENIKEATLYINKEPCKETTGCDRMLERMLPKGAKLTIIAPGGFEKVYIGK